MTLIEKIDYSNIDNSILEKFADIIKKGGTVIFPTETVYGLGADALDENATKKIYEAKGRPSDNPLLVHISEISELEDLVEDIPDRAKKLIDMYWPGPLTIVFKKKDIIPYRTSGGLDTVAIRMPSDEVARRLIRLSETPIAAPSANISGRPSPTKPEHIIRDMDGRVEGILMGGECNFGLESTIVDVSTDPVMILRPGAITPEMIKEVLGDVEIDPSIMKKDDNIKAKAPGMKYTHYSPNADVSIVSGDERDIVNFVSSEVEKNLSKAENAERIAVICLNKYKDDYDKFRQKLLNDGIEDAYFEVITIGKDYDEAAKNLFDSLIELDRRGIKKCYAHSYDEKGIGVAIMNRLKKSAGYSIISV